MEKKCLPDIPWHVGFAKKQEEDPRRHKARCIHINEMGVCTCMKAGAYTCKCGGSSHCLFYAETREQWEKVKINTQTAEEESQERIEKYKKTLRVKRESINNNSSHPIHYVELNKVIRCAVCDERVVSKGTIMFCKYCGTYYTSRAQANNVKNANGIREDNIIIVGQRRDEEKKDTKKIHYSCSCVHSGKKNKCTLITSNRHGKLCKKEGCVDYSAITHLK